MIGGEVAEQLQSPLSLRGLAHEADQCVGHTEVGVAGELRGDGVLVAGDDHRAAVAELVAAECGSVRRQCRQRLPYGADLLHV
jgi:hypothetical protein